MLFLLAAGLLMAWCQLQPAVAERATCPGRINMKGYGNVSLIPAGWHSPGTAGRVEVAGGATIVPHIRGRAYFADSCSAGDYDREQYLALKLLGKALRYTTDLSGIGCGCNAGLYLVPMRQNEDPSWCNDYYCDANRACGVACAEIDVQEANQFAWHSTLHSSHDQNGLAGGNGGSGGPKGAKEPRDWPNSEFSPGSGCIDTSKPFQVTASFPVDAAGNLIALEVTLSQDRAASNDTRGRSYGTKGWQEGHTCSLSTRVHGYSDQQMISNVLAVGVTPVVSYWSSDNMRWLDGPGRDGRGPCAEDAAQACRQSARFYGFSLEEISASYRREFGGEDARGEAEKAQKAAAAKELESKCPGSVPLEGYGKAEIVPAGWTKPATGSAGVSADALHVRNRSEVVLRTNSRGYFAETCQAGSYNNWQYMAIDLLGKRLRYVTDLSKLGTGCTASLSLVPMRHNAEATECGDYYCDADSSCGASCAEIVVQLANRHLWQSALRSRGHSQGQLQWSFDQDSDAECVDSSKPFEVVADFPMDAAGHLSELRIRLEQGKGCSLSMRLGNHTNLHGFAMAMAQGTPVLSVRTTSDSKETCTGEARFSGFSIENLPLPHFPQRPGPPASPGKDSKQASQAESKREAASAAVLAAASFLLGDERKVDDAKKLKPRCPGSVEIRGYGNASLVPTGWKTGRGHRAGIEVDERSNTVTPRMGSRAYFADSCDAGEYHRDKYMALNLLGKKLTYTTDLSGAGCGCNAALYLVSMRQNPRPSECYDYYCDANNVCGESCDEIDIQEGNQFAWHSTFHTWNDHNGLSGGFGGGGPDWNGPRDWNASDYGPGSRCIDTKLPVRVAVSFHVDQDGQVAYMEVELSQDGHQCSLRKQLYGYRGLSELSAALSLGMTPVISYWSSNDLAWMDGPGEDGKGACAVDDARKCGDSVSFYDFAVEELHTAPKKAGPDVPEVKTVTEKPAPKPVGPGPCLGVVHVEGQGPLSLVPSGPTSRSNSTPAAVVDGRQVRSAFGDRIYLAEHYDAESYDAVAYSSWKMLGKTLRYTTDVSKAGMAGSGCGCTAALYLVAMPQNKRAGSCHDYYCDANGACGVSCVEVDIQKANKFAWHSMLHGRKDPAGTSVQGGGFDWNGPRTWTSGKYAPGAGCIDTDRPFQVAVSFPVDKDGHLLALEVNLTQDGCSLTGKIRDYEDMPAISKALADGMTPVISYSSASDSLLKSGESTESCAVLESSSCGESASFTDLRVELLPGLPEASPRTTASPLAMSTDEYAREAAQKVLDSMKNMREEEAAALLEAQESMREETEAAAHEMEARKKAKHAKNATRGCAEAFKQCGGSGFHQPHCCMTGCRCQQKSVYYSQCIPTVAHADSCAEAAAMRLESAVVPAASGAGDDEIFERAKELVSGGLERIPRSETGKKPLWQERGTSFNGPHREIMMKSAQGRGAVDPLRHRLARSQLIAASVFVCGAAAFVVVFLVVKKRGWKKSTGPCSKEQAGPRIMTLEYSRISPPEANPVASAPSALQLPLKAGETDEVLATDA